jgi:hypothetical protein
LPGSILTALMMPATLVTDFFGMNTEAVTQRLDIARHLLGRGRLLDARRWLVRDGVAGLQRREAVS